VHRAPAEAPRRRIEQPYFRHRASSVSDSKDNRQFSRSTCLTPLLARARARYNVITIDGRRRQYRYLRAIPVIFNGRGNFAAISRGFHLRLRIKEENAKRGNAERLSSGRDSAMTLGPKGRCEQ